MKDQIVRVPSARLSVADVERWHARIRNVGAADATVRNLHGVLRAAIAQAVRWERVTTNWRRSQGCGSPRPSSVRVMSLDGVRAVLTAAAEIDRAAVLAFRVAAVTGAAADQALAASLGEILKVTNRESSVSSL